MPRELWKGAIQFGLVHIPVSLYPAEQREELSFTMLDRRDLQPVGYKRFNKTTGDEVPYEQIVKGYEMDEGHYVTLEKEDFKRANVEATQTVDIVGFIERESLAPFFFDAPYYLAPGKHGDKGYALLRETLVRTGRVGIANVVIRTREHVAALYAVDNVLVLNTLRYAADLRNPAELKVPDDLAKVKVTPKELDMAERLVEDMQMDWDPAKFHDTYSEDLMKLIEEKAAGKVRKAPKARKESSAEVIDFAALLERSLAGGKRGKAAEGKAVAAKARRKPPHRGGARAASGHRRAA
jgi:DNA end-binding protein Ku